MCRRSGRADPADSLPSAPTPATGTEVGLPVAAKAGFKEALAAHGGRPVSLVVLTSLIGKVARVELRNDSLAQISQHTLPRRAGELYPEDIEPGGF